MIKDRLVTKTLHKKTKKIHEEVSVCSIKKERKKSHFQFSIKKLLSKNERNLPSILFKSQHDTFQWAMSPHSLVTGARGGEAQRADAAARHQGRSKLWTKKNSGPIPVIYRNFLNSGFYRFFFPIPGVYQFFFQYRGFIGVVTKKARG